MHVNYITETHTHTTYGGCCAKPRFVEHTANTLTWLATERGANVQQTNNKPGKIGSHLHFLTVQRHTHTRTPREREI